MRKYFYLQCKRLARFLPGALCVVLVLLAGLAAAFSLMMQQSADSEESHKFQIGMCGTAENNLLQMGLAALETFDNTRFSIEILQMEEQEAAAALNRGDIPAYVVIPDGFVDAAMHGQILPLKFVSTVGAAGMVSVFKEEVTQVVSTLLVEAQKGIFGMMDAFEGFGVPYDQSLVDKLSIEYVEFVFARDNAYSLQELGIADALSLVDYLLCGLTVLFFLLSCLPFAPLMIRQDMALERMLAARGKPVLLQNLCDLAAYTLCLLVMLLAVGAVALAVLQGFGMSVSAAQVWETVLCAVPVILLTAAMSFMLYSLAADLIGGVLLQFFVTLAMCFVSGCMYPAYFFPETVQKLASWLPTGIARTQLSTCITGEQPGVTVMCLLAYSVVFFAVGALARKYRLDSEQR